MWLPFYVFVGGCAFSLFFSPAPARFILTVRVSLSLCVQLLSFVFLFVFERVVCWRARVLWILQLFACAFLLFLSFSLPQVLEGLQYLHSRRQVPHRGFTVFSFTIVWFLSFIPLIFGRLMPVSSGVGLWRWESSSCHLVLIHFWLCLSVFLLDAPRY